MSQVTLDEGTPSAKFYELFPTGEVPIRFGIGDSALGRAPSTPDREAQVRNIFCDEYERTMAAFDAVNELGMNVDELERLREEFVNAEPTSSRDRTRADLVARMMQWGMTLAAIARYVGTDDDTIVNALLGGGRPRTCSTEVVIYADTLLAEHACSIRQLARDLHVDRDMLSTLRSARQLGVSGRGGGKVAHNEDMTSGQGAAA